MASEKAKKQQPDFVLSSDPNKAAQEMIDIIDVLGALYETENAVLAKADVKGFMAMQDTKIEAARRYHAAAAQMFERKDNWAGKIDPRLLHSLKSRQEPFALLGKTNLDNLDRIRRCTRRLSDRIMQAARDSVRKDSHAYGKRGKLEYSDRRVSIGLNASA